MSSAAITVVGEAVIDLVQGPDGRFTAHPGGSPLNVAVGLARLGVPVRLLARLSASAFGRRLREHAHVNGVDTSHVASATEPATLAVVSLAANGTAAYDFYLDGTADWQWRPGELSAALDRGGVLHAGSLAAFVHPGAEHVAAALRAARDHGMVVSLDPNIRPGLVGTPGQARARVEQLVEYTHIVKASQEDIAWLYPGERVDTVLQRWRDLGAELAIATLGSDGAVTATSAGMTRHRAPAVEVIDTIGAGDAFTAGLLAALARTGSGPGWHHAEIAAAAQLAIEVATISCTREGADPPHWSQLSDRMGWTVERAEATERA